MTLFARLLLLRIAGLLLTGGGLGYAIGAAPTGQLAWLSAALLLAIWQSVSLYRFLTGINRKLTRFLESVQYADFTSTFRADNGLGPSFRGLNDQFNTVLDAFRQARAENEANLQFLNTMVQHVTVGLLAFDGAGNVALINQTALRLLGLYRLRQLTDLQTVHPALITLLNGNGSAESAVYHTSDQVELSVRCTNVRLRGRLLTVVSLQNIHSELQQKELEAWQNLTSVLRHEIMNSITPIVSLVGTMRTILDDDLPALLTPSSVSSHPSPFPSPLDDLQLALATIERRGQGIMQFVGAYRHFTTIPLPNRVNVSVADVFQSVLALIKADAQANQIAINCPPIPQPLWVSADTGQIDMVLLNLLRNAIESLTHQPNPTITLTAQTNQGRICMLVSDNGPGIEPDALEKIFTPFFTTKKAGSGIGLSLSRQIMQAHGGQLRAESVVGAGSTFTLLFP